MLRYFLTKVLPAKTFVAILAYLKKFSYRLQNDILIYIDAIF